MSAPSLREVVRSVGWLAGGSAPVDFDSANWSTVEEDGLIRLEGYTDDREWAICLTLKVESCHAYPHSDDEFDTGFDDDDTEEDA